MALIFAYLPNEQGWLHLGHIFLANDWGISLYNGPVHEPYPILVRVVMGVIYQLLSTAGDVIGRGVL